MSLGQGRRGTYSRELCSFGTTFPLFLDRAVDRCRDKVLCDEIAICQHYFFPDATADGLSATPCSIDTIGHRRGNREMATVWAAIGVRIERTGMNHNKKSDLIDTMLHLL